MSAAAASLSSSKTFSLQSSFNESRVSTTKRSVNLRVYAAQNESLERVEPRVELREGYWVLKEKFRQGINPSEKVKIEKEPMKLITEDGISELAGLSLEEIEKSKIGKDDIDVRLKWLGLFHRRKHHYGRFMMRLKLPNGVTTSAQTRYLASVIKKYGKDGCADVTTRQNLQIRGVVLSDVSALMKGLAAVGLTSLQSGMDNVRNPVGNPLAGIDPDEIVDTRPCTNLLSQFITGNFQGNLDFTNFSKLICKLTGATINKSEEHIRKHINGKQFLNKLGQAECSLENERRKNKPRTVVAPSSKNKRKEKGIAELISEIREAQDNSDSDEGIADGFWVPLVGAGSSTGSDSEEETTQDSINEECAVVSKELSKRTKRMTIEIGPSSFATRKKKTRSNTTTSPSM